MDVMLAFSAADPRPPDLHTSLHDILATQLKNYSSQINSHFFPARERMRSQDLSAPEERRVYLVCTARRFFAQLERRYIQLGCSLVMSQALFEIGISRAQ